MKKSFKLFFLIVLASISTGSFTACSEDEFGESIFEIKPDFIDKTAYTAPLDSFVKKCFLIPYNVDFKYKMEDISSDVNKNLVPASYQKCKELAVLTKYLWYDVYKENVGDSERDGELLLKKYSPRIIHLIGSKNVNPNTGTEVLGEAASGIMTTLFRGNTLNVNNIDYCNKYFFKTMHHEFGHMLHSNYVVPTEYRTLTAGTYDALSWQETSDSVALGQGYISQYSRNNYNDDFVEMFSVFLTSTDKQWQNRLNTSKWAWEEVEVMYDYWRKLNSQTPDEGIDSIGYLKEISLKNDGKCKIIRKKIKRESVEGEESTVYAHALLKCPNCGKEYVPNQKIQIDKDDYSFGNYCTSCLKYEEIKEDDVDSLIIRIEGNDKYKLNPNSIFNGQISYVGEGGYDYIMKKFDILKNYLVEHYNIDIYRLRDDINRRCYYMDDDGNFLYDNKGNVINRVKDVLPQLLDDLENYRF